ncbi:MAG: hypothetical protein IPG60_10410 [Bacteroidetes bacterium]|nr:hypothetical protein [Bacteroidota bacterium]MBK7108842.1 hypothetical protein [Bacteroidota bacterium]MBK8488829.1 hypothetical protein [Bacteroidota bacterium]MBK8680681.1 hypothetical protein [Bacteroidota bacterium]MBP9189146.1 hypothetical protein [Chitinophagales bacterium]
MQVEVFKTNITTQKEAKKIIALIKRLSPNLKTNFDLDDCDKILRIEGEVIDNIAIINLVTNLDYTCEDLI